MIPVVLLKNFEPELWFLLAALFSMCLQESYFPDCLKVWSVVPVFNNVGWDVYGKKSCSVILLSAVSKVFGKLVNKSFFDHHIWFPVQFQVFLISCRSDKFNTFDRVWHPGLLHKLKFFWIFRSCIWPYFAFEWFWMGSFYKIFN